MKALKILKENNFEKQMGTLIQKLVWGETISHEIESDFIEVQLTRKVVGNLRAIDIHYYQLRETIISFQNLIQNWDGNGAEPISNNAISTALEVLKELNKDGLLFPNSNIATHVFPMRDGGIQYEFDSESSSIELEINPDGVLWCTSFDNDGNIIETYQIHNSEFSELLYIIAECTYHA